MPRGGDYSESKCFLYWCRSLRVCGFWRFLTFVTTILKKIIPFRGRLLSSSPSTLSIIPISLPLLLLLPLDREKEKFARFSPSYFCCQKMEKKFWDATRDGRVEVVKDVLGKNLSLNANWNDDSLS